MKRDWGNSSPAQEVQEGKKALTASKPVRGGTTKEQTEKTPSEKRPPKTKQLFHKKKKQPEHKRGLRHTAYGQILLQERRQNKKQNPPNPIHPNQKKRTRRMYYYHYHAEKTEGANWGKEASFIRKKEEGKNPIDK